MPKRSAGVFAYNDENMAALRLTMAPSVIHGQTSLPMAPGAAYNAGLIDFLAYGIRAPATVSARPDCEGNFVCHPLEGCTSVWRLD